MHDRTHERGALIGRKDRDRVDVQADEDEEFHDDDGILGLRQDVSGAAHSSRNSAAGSALFAFTRRSGRAISAKITLTKASLTLRSGRRSLRTARSTG